jgi:gliding motility-associated-like protein
MKRFLPLIIVFLTSLGFSAKASHQSAADIYYDYVSPLTYRVHLIIYRDCTGITQGSQESMNAVSASLGQCIPFIVDTTGIVTGFEVGSLCPNVPSQCTNTSSTFVGYEEWHYSGEVILPAVAKDWKFTWASCCRNGAIDNMNPNGMGVYALLNNLARPINSSVRLLIKPIPYVCINQPQQYLNGPYDPDNDSIHFEAATPLDNVGCNTEGPVTYISPYTYTVPIACSSNIYTINQNTGTASFQPNAFGQYVLGFRCWDIDRITGDTVGMVMRDVQINVVSCASPPPVADTMISAQWSATNHITTCPGNPIQFTIKGYSLSGSNNLHGTSTAAFTCPGSTMNFTPATGGSIVTGTFNWTPTTGGTSVIIVEFDDSTCTTAQPIVLKSYATIQITVLDGVSAGGPYNFCLNGDSLHLSALGPAGMNTWSWTNITPGTPNFSAPNSANTAAAPTIGMFVELTGLPAITGCPNKDTVYLNVFPAIGLTPGGPYDVCANVATQLLPIATNAAGASYTWSPATYLSSSNIQNPFCTPLTNTNYQLNLVTVDGCKKSINVDVHVKGITPFVNTLAEKNPVCANEPFKVFANASPQPCGPSVTACAGAMQNKTVGTGTVVNGNYSPFLRDYNSAYRAQYLIRADELLAAGLTTGTIKGIKLNVLTNNTIAGTDSLLNFKVKLGCTPNTDMNAGAGFNNALTTVYSALKYAPTVGVCSINFPSSGEYFWDGKSNLIVEFCYGQPNFAGGTSAEVASASTSFNSAILAQAFTGSACSLPSTTVDIVSLRPNITFNFCKAPQFTYSWTPANLFNDPTLANPTLKNGIPGPAATFSVNVYSNDPSCNATSSVSVVTDETGSIDASVNTPHICNPMLVTLKGVPTPSTVNPTYTCGDSKYTITGGPALFTTVNNGSNNNGPFSSYPGAKMQYIIPASELIGLGMTGGPYELSSMALNVIQKYTTANFNNYQVKLGCTSSPTISGFMNIGDMKTVYSNASYGTTLGWNTVNFQTPFLWNGVSNVLVEICYFRGINDGWSDDYVAVTNNAANIGFGALSYDAGCEIPLAGTYFNNFNNGIWTNHPQTQFTASKCAPKPFDYVWQPSLFVYDTTAATTLGYVAQSGTYTVSLLNKTGCKRSDTVQVRIETHDVTVSPTDTLVCEGDLFPAFVYGTGSGVNPKYKWTPSNTDLSCDTCTLVFIKPTTLSTTYSIVRTDEFNCKDTAFLKAGLHKNPTVTISNGDSITVPYNNQVNLIATSTKDPHVVYSWTPAWALSDPNVFNPEIQPTQSGMYKVYGIDSNTCRSYDSIWINVDQTNPVAMINVFSPNGDGVNDRFRIYNYKFERVQEFKVFTRWGLEVFSGTDNTGWDGTFKGQNMDMDTYTYLIRLAYPDGNVKTIKGDFILLR